MVGSKHRTQCTRNAVRCLKCDSVIESVRRHDFITCKCGGVSVDGGIGWCDSICMRRLWKDGAPEDWYEDLSEFEDVPLTLSGQIKGKTHGK